MRGARRASIFCSTYVVTFATRLAQCEGDYVSRTDRVAIAPSLFRVLHVDSERGSVSKMLSRTISDCMKPEQVARSRTTASLDKYFDVFWLVVFVRVWFDLRSNLLVTPNLVHSSHCDYSVTFSACFASRANYRVWTNVGNVESSDTRLRGVWSIEYVRLQLR